MKTIITLIASFYLLCPLYSMADNSNETIEASNELIGKWKLVNLRCEDNRELSDFDKQGLKYYLSLKHTLEFQTNGNAIHTMSAKPFFDIIQTNGNVTAVSTMEAMVTNMLSSLTCVGNITSPYTLSEKVISEHIKDSTVGTFVCSIDDQKAQFSTLPDKIKQQFEVGFSTLADTIKQQIEDSIEATKKEKQSISQEFEIQGDKVLFYYEKSLPQSVTIIDCEDSRAVQEFERI